jgi:hypothetical protein
MMFQSLLTWIGYWLMFGYSARLSDRRSGSCVLNGTLIGLSDRILGELATPQRSSRRMQRLASHHGGHANRPFHKTSHRRRSMAPPCATGVPSKIARVRSADDVSLPLAKQPLPPSADQAGSRAPQPSTPTVYRHAGDAKPDSIIPIGSFRADDRPSPPAGRFEGAAALCDMDRVRLHPVTVCRWSGNRPPPARRSGRGAKS